MGSRLDIRPGQVWTCSMGLRWRVDRTVRDDGTKAEHELEALDPAHRDAGTHWRYCRADGAFFPTPLMPDNRLTNLESDSPERPARQPHDEEQ